MSLQGTVKIFNSGKGFGFITAADGSDVFVHISGVVDGNIPLKGDTVTFDCAESSMKPGQMQASNVSGGTGSKGSGKGTGEHAGQVKNFNPEKGFGFIIGPDGSDIFLHIKAIIDGSTPQQGDTLQYDQEPNPAKPGQMRASNVSGGTGFGGNHNGGKGKGKGDGWGGKGEGWDAGYGAVDSWDGWGKGKAGPYGDCGKGKGKMAAMMQMMNWGWGDDGWGGEGWDGWGGKGDGWGGKCACKGDGWGFGKGGEGYGKGKDYGGKGDNPWGP